MAPLQAHPYRSTSGHHPLPLMDDELRVFSKRDLSDLIWIVIKSTPRSLTFSSACAVAIEGIILGIILLQTTRYLSSFGRTDPLWAVAGIILGAITLYAQFGLNLWQTYRLIDKASSELFAVIVGDIRSNMTVLVIIGVLNFVAAGFFGRRAWLLAKKRIWVLIPLVIGIFSSLGLSLGVAIKGFLLPSITADSSPAILMKYNSWRNTDNQLIVIWASIALLQDILVCALMTTMLLKEKMGFQKTERTLLKMLIRLTYETMAGPVLLNIANVIVVAHQGATFAGYSRIVTWILGPVYFSAILQSLNYRKDVQQILRVTPIPRSRPSSKGNRSTLQRTESPSIPLTSTDLRTRENSFNGSIHTGEVSAGGETIRYRSDEHSMDTGHDIDNRRERANTMESEVGSSMTTDIVLGEEKV
ncbi:uncharacterized protein IL334_001516 [Kwoniella shivajii]|uniref:DUF6534 domain-containing protein n=1 Tax=Kwoniella shivajii TaxID=564305 RepID=A0ABZ1CS41_9TREE|nr:hypothetical protein IL334_001516 [Kwoniella shivajii]